MGSHDGDARTERKARYKLPMCAAPEPAFVGTEFRRQGCKRLGPRVHLEQHDPFEPVKAPVAERVGARRV
jgi:hypothetical protein